MTASVYIFTSPIELRIQNFVLKLVEFLFTFHAKCTIEEYRIATEDEFTNNGAYQLVG
jgi:hypothetical protein